MKNYLQKLFFVCVLGAASFAACFSLCLNQALAQKMTTITDSAGRQVCVPSAAENVICSGPGCLRLLVYLQASDRVVAVDSMEKDQSYTADPRAYVIANPGLKSLPLFGEFRGMDNPELIAALEPRPQVIFKTFANMGHDPDELQQKTGIPVVVLQYGNLTDYRRQLNESLKIMGKIMGKASRAQEVIDFFDQMIADLDSRTKHKPAKDKKTCYVGGIAFKGPHGFRSTEPAYPPFVFNNASHPANDTRPTAGPVSHAQVAREQILAWNPDILFLDLSSTVSNPGASALDELYTDRAYMHLDAVQKGEVYGVMPYNWYAQNFGAIFANAYFVGKKLYPAKFHNIDPEIKADEIFTFLVGGPAFKQINKMFGNLVFTRVLEAERP
jgi:iron complex transport system substrate-binding protein